MTPTPRKSGIRLPWSHDDDSDATTAAESGAEASEPTATSDATPMEAGDQAEAAPLPTPLTAQAGAAAQASHEPESPEEPTADVDNTLLVSLITAMREVAERERESSVSTLRQSVDESVETLRTRAAEQAEQLRERSEGDISAIGDWVNAETERIATEGERRRETRRQLLTQQLSDHEQRSGTEIESLYARIQEYERQLTTFFAQLHDINDPAAFGTAAKRMPRPPSIVSALPASVPPQQADAASAKAGEASDHSTATAAGTSDASPQEQPAEPTVTETSAEATEATGEATGTQAAALDTEASSEEAPATDQAAEEPAAEEPAAEEPAAEGSSTIVPDTHDARLTALGIDRNGSEAEESLDESAAPSAEIGISEAAPVSEGEAPSDPLRARLAELDAKIGGETSGEAATATVVAPGAGGEVATAIIVHGLGSFGAITSFKQALERVDGVHGISLSLGPTGEFVYRATHDPEFDLVAAIEQIEHGGAQIERQPDGSLRVVVQRGR